MIAKQPLVSIIIPTYNRAHLIGETLDSVLAQTYQNWECIIVDDGSTDDTAEVVGEYVQKDTRFQYHQRPTERPKGANACRNYGMELSVGEYIKWFDSDDLMLPVHLESLTTAIEDERVDFVIGDSLNFISGEHTSRKPYTTPRETKLLSASIYAKGGVGWITDDFMAKREAINTLRFNERLSAGQEYNFFIRFLLYNQNGFFVDKILTKARLHNQSLSSQYQFNRIKKYKIIQQIKFRTLQDVYKVAPKELSEWFLSGFIQYSYMLALQTKLPNYLGAASFYLINFKRLNQVGAFYLGILTSLFFKKGYRLIRYSRK